MFQQVLWIQIDGEGADNWLRDWFNGLYAKPLAAALSQLLGQAQALALLNPITHCQSHFMESNKDHPIRFVHDSRAWYGDSIAGFLAATPETILGLLASNGEFQAVIATLQLVTDAFTQ